MRAVGGRRILRILAIESNIRHVRADDEPAHNAEFRHAFQPRLNRAGCGEFRRHKGRVKMANRIQLLRRRATLAAGTIFLGTVGCAFPQGTTGGDPMLGNFNRPIVPTPPPERGGLGLDSPAYDSGARIGMQSPDIPTPLENTSGFQSLPPASSTGIMSGIHTPFGTPSDATLGRRSGAAIGARLPAAIETGPRMPSAPTGSRYSAEPQAYRGKDPVSSLTSGSAIAPPDPSSGIKLASHEVPRDASRIEKMEEGFEMLQAAGAKGLRTEQLSSNEWLFACAVGPKVYEARGQDQLEAMRRVLEQVNKRR